MKGSEIPESELLVAEKIGQLMHFWGFKKPMGKIWTLLHLSETSMTASELAKHLQMSSGSISMALNELERWQAIRRHSPPGERKDYFSAESDIWTLVRGVLGRR
ncbi:MAG: hypothetical protein MK135_17040, partial [Polyangiaceae bacterium]|nr:hypothetical protein [Polyangiaceae bacterium]